MHTRYLHISAEFLANDAPSANQEKRILDLIAAIFTPESQPEFKISMSRSYTYCIQTTVGIQVSDTQDRMLKTMRKRAKEFKTMIKRIYRLGAELEITLSTKESVDTPSIIWEFGSSTSWKIIEMLKDITE